MRRFRSLPLVGLLLIGGAPALGETGSAKVTPGPLGVRDHFLLAAGYLGLEPSAADVLERGRWRFDAVWSLSNTWAISPDIDLALRDRPGREPITRELLDELALLSPDGGSIFVDGEISRLSLSLARGLGRRAQIELLVPIVQFSGLGLDASIERLHDALGTEDGRSGAPRDAFLVSLISGLPRFEQRRRPSSGIGDIVLAAKVRVAGEPSSSFRASIEALAKLPTGGDEPLASSGSADYGFQVLLARHLERWSFHGSSGIVFLGDSDRLGIGSQELFTASGTIERALGARTSLVAQLSASESPFGDLATSRVGLTAVQATFGVKRAVGHGYELFAAATENFENFTNTADINFHLGLARSFR